MNFWRQTKEYVYVAGHRGWPAIYPENTLASFRGVLSLSVDQIETDVRVTSDGELVLIHDATVDRTTNGQGRVRDFSFKELRRLDAGVKKDPSFAGERIPTLRELFELVKDHPTLTLDLELKEYPDGTGQDDRIAFDVCDRTVAMTEEYGFSDRVVLNTFSAPLMEYIHKNYPEYRTHVYFPRHHMRGDGEPYPGAYCACVFDPPAIRSGKLSIEEIVGFSKKYGIRLWAGTYASDPADLEQSLEWGAELITANNPDRVLEMLRAKGLHD